MIRRLYLVIAIFGSCVTISAAEPWVMHTIDDSSRGADGVRLGDVDSDGRVDIVTGWEEGGKVRICFQPPKEKIHERWPGVTVGNVRSPEDAVFCDVNHDGWLDVVTCCEGRQQAVFVHLNPAHKDAVRIEERWKTNVVKETKDVTRWMFCEPLKPRQLVLGSKEPRGRVVLFQPADPAGTQTKLLRNAGWIMSLRRFDVDQDGEPDLIYSDRKGATRGIGWLQLKNGKWTDHVIGGTDREVMFLDIRHSADGLQLICNTRHCLIRFDCGEDPEQPWQMSEIAHPPAVGTGKGVAFGDIDVDGDVDIVCTCENAKNVSGVFWLDEQAGDWQFQNISGKTRGIKFDRIELIDIDADGDLDVLTCEERDQLGVVWYENPVHKAADLSRSTGFQNPEPAVPLSQAPVRPRP